MHIKNSKILFLDQHRNNLHPAWFLIRSERKIKLSHSVIGTCVPSNLQIYLARKFSWQCGFHSNTSLIFSCLLIILMMKVRNITNHVNCRYPMKTKDSGAHNNKLACRRFPFQKQLASEEKPETREHSKQMSIHPEIQFYSF